jgi:hypothetical protein
MEDHQRCALALEADMRSDIAFCDRVHQFIDKVKRQINIGLCDSRQIGRILVRLRNLDIVYVPSIGHAYDPNPERDVFSLFGLTGGPDDWMEFVSYPRSSFEVNFCASQISLAASSGILSTSIPSCSRLSSIASLYFQRDIDQSKKDALRFLLT